MQIKVRNMAAVFYAALFILMSACGFQFRGHAELPAGMEKIYVQSDASALLLRYLRQSLSQAGALVVTDINKASAVMVVGNEVQDRSVLSVNDKARVREYESRYSVTYSVATVAGEEILSPRIIELRRDYSFNEDEVLAKERERISLVGDMQAEAVQAIMRQIRNRPQSANRQNRSTQ
jgi:LPS-assembly lipoprotein